MTSTDRYKALGLPYPDLETMCRECEGMGYIPTKLAGDWTVKRCPACRGTRLAPKTAPTP